ncbi:hypothetical protein Tco_1096637 [Tanacetum coccineum]
MSKYRCARTELITSDLTYPLTRQLLRNSGGGSGPDLSFDKLASPERLFSLARVSLAEASKPDLSFGGSGGDYTSSIVQGLKFDKVRSHHQNSEEAGMLKDISGSELLAPSLCNGI